MVSATTAARGYVKKNLQNLGMKSTPGAPASLRSASSQIRSFWSHFRTERIPCAAVRLATSRWATSRLPAFLLGPLLAGGETGARLLRGAPRGGRLGRRGNSDHAAPLRRCLRLRFE